MVTAQCINNAFLLTSFIYITLSTAVITHLKAVTVHRLEDVKVLEKLLMQKPNLTL